MSSDSTLPYFDKLREKLRERPMRKNLDPVRNRARELLDKTAEDARPTVVQVVGSNGKGSVVHYLSELLKTATSVVSFTSPHLVQPGDRIKLDGAPLSPGELDDALESFGADFLKDYTPFEALFLVALRTGLRNSCDFLVLEAGMGGRWDATSAIEPEWVILTSIDLEHTDYLGTTRREILREKLAQVPTQGKIITAHLDHQDSQDGLNSMVSTKNLTHVRLAKKSPPDEINRRLALLGGRFLLDTPAGDLAERLDETAGPPGRQEFLSVDGRTVVLDVAHTPRAIDALVDRLETETTFNHRYLLFGSLRGKDTGAILSRLSRTIETSRTILTEPNSPRALPGDRLAAQWDDASEPSINPDPAEGLQTLLDRSRPGDLILVTGSFDLIGDARNQLKQ